MIAFRAIELSDCKLVRQQVYPADCRNCDLNFMNLMSWRFLYKTELAFHHGWLLLRFWFDGHIAYLPPIGEGQWNDILEEMMEDARSIHEPFRLMGVCEHSLVRLNETMPGIFESSVDRAYSDYLYKRETLASLGGKKLQSKRNHIHRFEKEHPNYEYLPLGENFFGECLELVKKWHLKKGENSNGGLSLAEEENALQFTFDHWAELCGRGGVLRIDGKIIAFTYGAPINYDTFDICVEKADIEYDGAFTMINREFARALPEEFIYINREEDLGLEGLRKAKMSYQPDILLHKNTVSVKLL